MIAAGRRSCWRTWRGFGIEISRINRLMSLQKMEAKRRIREAEDTGETVLDLSHIYLLYQVPLELNRLESLQTLDLSGCSQAATHKISSKTVPSGRANAPPGGTLSPKREKCGPIPRFTENRLPAHEIWLVRGHGIAASISITYYLHVINVFCERCRFSEAKLI